MGSVQEMSSRSHLHSPKFRRGQFDSRLQSRTCSKCRCTSCRSTGQPEQLLSTVDIVGTMLSVEHHSSDLLQISIDAVYKFINEYTGSKIPQHDIQNQSASKCLDMVRHAKGGLPIVKLNELPKPGGISQDHCPVDLSRNWKLIASEDPFNPGGRERNCFQRACVLCLGRPWTDNRMLTDVAYSSSHVSPSLQSSTVKFFCCSCPCCFSPSLRLSPGAVP